MTSFEKLSSPIGIPEYTPFRQTVLGDASSTEGTPSPNSAIARRLSASQSQPLAPNARLSSFTGSVASSLDDSLASKKRAHNSTPDRELVQPNLYRQVAIGAALDQNLRKRTKISTVNSPWTFRTTY